MKESKPITITDELAAQYTAPDQVKRFENAVRHVLSVPRATIIQREAEYKKRAAMNPNRRGPKTKRA